MKRNKGPMRCSFMIAIYSSRTPTMQHLCTVSISQLRISKKISRYNYNPPSPHPSSTPSSYPGTSMPIQAYYTAITHPTAARP